MVALTENAGCFSAERVQVNVIEFRAARIANQDKWVVACGGRETPISYCGENYLYVFNFRTHEHGYLFPDDIVRERPPWETACGK